MLATWEFTYSISSHLFSRLFSWLLLSLQSHCPSERLTCWNLVRAQFAISSLSLSLSKGHHPSWNRWIRHTCYVLISIPLWQNRILHAKIELYYIGVMVMALCIPGNTDCTSRSKGRGEKGAATSSVKEKKSTWLKALYLQSHKASNGFPSNRGDRVHAAIKRRWKKSQSNVIHTWRVSNCIILTVFFFSFTCSIGKNDESCPPETPLNTVGTGISGLRVCVRRCGRRRQSGRPVLGAEVPPRADWCPSKPEVCLYVIFNPSPTVTLIIELRLNTSTHGPPTVIQKPWEQKPRGLCRGSGI